MISISTISWFTFFIILGILFLVWILTTRSKFLGTLIQRETPWDIRQWNLLLIIIGLTFFILVNPVIHLLTTGIIAALYYMLINKDALGRKAVYNNKKKDLYSSSLDPKSEESLMSDLICEPLDGSNEVSTRKAIDRCVFSFPMVAQKPCPEVNYIKGKYYVSAELTSQKYLASFISFIEKAGFDVNLKNE